MNQDRELGQRGFDPLGPTVRRAELPTGRTVHYLDEGEPDWQPLLFLGGAGTSVRAFRLVEFARTLREELRIRVVSVERNGLGQTPFDPAAGPTEYAADVWALLDRLGIDRPSILAISGGGPYAAHLAAAHPKRVRSLHLACAYAERLADPLPHRSAEQIAADPAAWWRYPDDSPLHRIPGFVDSTVEEATRASFALGRDTDPAGLRQAFEIYRDQPLPDLSHLLAPAFLYWGEQDRLVTTAHLTHWQKLLREVRETRLYPGEGHDVQYRHWDQILADVALLGTGIVVCHRRRSLLVPPERAAGLLADGASLGLCAWSAPG